MSSWLAPAAIGLVAGLLSGGFGIGGGVIVLPAIRLLLGYPELVSVGTTLPVILPTALAGALTHLRSGNVRLRAGIVTGVWGMPAAVLGALAARAAGGPTVLTIAAIVIIVAAIGVVRGSRPALESPDASEGVVASGVGAARFALLGVATGFYSGLLGLGGGFVLVPLLQRFAGFGIKTAIGTSLIAVAILAVPGSVTHAMMGNVDLPLALALSIGVVPGAVVGARITIGVKERWVRWAFATLLAFVGLTLALSESGVL